MPTTLTKPQRVTLDQLPVVIDRFVQAGLDELFRAGKVEVGIELGDNWAEDQRYRTGRLAHSTSITGKQVIPFDPGPSPNDQLAFYLPASRTELTQAAESTIPPDAPGDPAHVIEFAGENPEDQAYASFIERRFRTGQKAIAKTEASEATIRTRSDRRAERALRRVV